MGGGIGRESFFWPYKYIYIYNSEFMKIEKGVCYMWESDVGWSEGCLDVAWSPQKVRNSPACIIFRDFLSAWRAES